MKKIRKIDVGTLLLSDSYSEFVDGIRKRSYIKFKNGGHFDDDSRMVELDGKHCYVVSKKDLDALEARNATLEEMNCTPVWDENQKLKKRVKELEGQLADQKKKYDKKLCEAFMETNAALYNGANRLIAIDKEIEDLKKQAEQIEELEKERDYWKDRFGSVVTDVSNVLSANGVEFTVEAIDGNKWNVGIDIPELNEMKTKVADLERKLDTAKSNESYWCKRKEEEEDNHYYWLHTYNLAVAHAANKGVNIFITGEDEENNVGVILVKNEKAEELEAKHDAKWSEMLQALKEKGVEVLYMGEEDGKPNIDVKIPAIGDLKKELDDLKSKKITKCTLDPSDGKLTFIYTYMDGHSESTCIIDDVDPNDVTPKCKSCVHYNDNKRFANRWCFMPISKEGGSRFIRKLSKEEAEGPACDKFEARKE